MALKELLFGVVPGAREVDAFEREARILCRLEHPSIPRHLEHFAEGEGPALRLYLAQELIDGRTLQDALRDGPLAEQRVVEIIRQVLDVLRYLHGQQPQVLHRDIKPANLVERADGTIALVDFGTARELQQSITHRGTVVGTWGYMPLEQHGGSVDARADLHALAATALHLLTGRPPEQFIKPDSMQLEVPARLPCSPGYAAVLRRMVSRAPGDRYPSAGAVLAALERLGHSRPASGRSTLVWAVGAAALLAVALIVGLSIRQAPRVEAPNEPSVLAASSVAGSGELQRPTRDAVTLPGSDSLEAPASTQPRPQGENQATSQPPASDGEEQIEPEDEAGSTAEPGGTHLDLLLGTTPADFGHVFTHDGATVRFEQAFFAGLRMGLQEDRRPRWLWLRFSVSAPQDSGVELSWRSWARILPAHGDPVPPFGQVVPAEPGRFVDRLEPGEVVDVAIVYAFEPSISVADLTLVDGWTRRFASSIPVLGY